MQLDVIIAGTLRTATALLFAAGLVHKLWDIGEFRRTVGAYLRGPGIDTAGLRSTIAGLVVVLEATVVVACLFAGNHPLAAALASGTLLLYAGAMGVNLIKGNTLLDCGCSWGSARQPVSSALVARNVLLAVVVLGMTLPTADRTLTAIDVASVALATLALALLYVASNHMLTFTGPARSTHG